MTTGSDDLPYEIQNPNRHEISVRPFQREDQQPSVRSLSIFTRDPTTSAFDGAVQVVELPWEPLYKGPWGRMFRVLDIDSGQDVRYAPIDLDDPKLLISDGLRPTTSDPRFAQQMVYAVGVLTYETFRRALGRAPRWVTHGRPRGPDEHYLVLYPHAIEQENAYYDPCRAEIRFGYFQAAQDSRGRDQPNSWVKTSLSHDVIVHELTHALLDGLRAHFLEPSNVDVLAFHEGFADLIAVLMHFSHRTVVERAIAKSRGRLDDDLLADLAQQFGQTRTGGTGDAIRSAIDCESIDDGPVAEEFRYDPRKGIHQLGSVLVSAVFEAFRVIYRRRTAALRKLAGVDRLGPNESLSDTLVEELAKVATKVAQQFLQISIRAIDYCPPVDVTFGEYLRALITADFDVVRDDPWGYREALISAFRRRMIVVPDVPDLSVESLLWEPPLEGSFVIPNLAVDKIRFHPGESESGIGSVRVEDRGDQLAIELGSFIANGHWRMFGLVEPGNEAAGGLVAEKPIVESVRPLLRISPDRESSYGIVAEVTQRYAQDENRNFYGGSTIIIGDDGRIRYAIRKPLLAPGHPDREARDQYWEENRARPEFLDVCGIKDSAGGGPFQFIHQPDEHLDGA